MDLGLQGKVAIVTGAGNGLGAEISRRLCEEGASVVVADIDAAASEATAAAIRAAGGRAVHAAADVTREESVSQMVTLAIQHYGAVDILVNNAGFTRDMRITKMAEADWDAVVDVILKGSFNCSRAALPLMVERGGGRIINISSRAHLGNAGQANYSSAKAGLLGFTRALALEWGSKLITVNAVAPGIIDTEAVRRLPHYEKVREAAQKTTPIPRIGEPGDVASTVAFLASKHASYITGEVVHVTGGRY
jgi:3-oxoacyl-[acyl-carrier protein] reductase